MSAPSKNCGAGTGFASLLPLVETSVVPLFVFWSDVDVKPPSIGTVVSASEVGAVVALLALVSVGFWAEVSVSCRVVEGSTVEPVVVCEFVAVSDDEAPDVAMLVVFESDEVTGAFVLSSSLDLSLDLSLVPQLVNRAALAIQAVRAVRAVQAVQAAQLGPVR